MTAHLVYHKAVVICALACSALLLLYGISTIDYIGGASQFENYFPGATSNQGVPAIFKGQRGKEIPNVFHFIIGAAHATIKLNFLAFIAIYAVHYHMPDAEIWLHTDAPDDMISRALSLQGLDPPQYVNETLGPLVAHEVQDTEYIEYWTQAVVHGVKNLKFKQITKKYSPTATGKIISSLANWADFVRADILYEHGGIVMDLDVVALRDVTPLRQAGFKNILARDLETQCGVIMSTPRNLLIRAYRDLMEGAFDVKSYAFHATSLLHVLRSTFVRIPYELLMLSDRAFYPISWNSEHGHNVNALWYIHKQKLAGGAREHGDLLDFDYDSWSEEFVAPTPSTFRGEGLYEIDFSETYLLHVYHSLLRTEIAAGRIKDETKKNKLAHGLTLPLVLEGNSHFSRVVWDLVHDALDKGYISV